MPAVVNKTVGSFAGTSDAEGMTVWPFPTKNSRNLSRSSGDVIRMGTFRAVTTAALMGSRESVGYARSSTAPYEAAAAAARTENMSQRYRTRIDLAMHVWCVACISLSAFNKGEHHGYQIKRRAAEQFSPWGN